MDAFLNLPGSGYLLIGTIFAVTYIVPVLVAYWFAKWLYRRVGKRLF